MTTLISKRLIIISGFTQSKAEPNGSEQLWLELRKHETPACRVSMQMWNTNWEHFAEHVWRTKAPDLDVRVFAYSWGVGNGFLCLAKELQKRAIGITHAVLCDGVYYNGWLPWRALFSPFVEPKIVVPENVGEVFWLFQRMNKPQAHGVTAVGDTTIHDPIELKCTHHYADESPEYHTLAQEVSR